MKKMESKTPTANKRKKNKKNPVTIPPINFYKTKVKNNSLNRSIKLKKKPLIENELENSDKIEYLKTESNTKTYKLKGNEIRKFEYIYSPRTTFIMEQEKENKLLQDLAKGFDPITIKIIKSFFKERLGEIDKSEFIGLLQNNLLTWHPELPNREDIM